RSPRAGSAPRKARSVTGRARNPRPTRASAWTKPGRTRTSGIERTLHSSGAMWSLGKRKTFDVVALTTPSEGRYWVMGAGSRLEHYERMPRALLPTHFIVYPEWMACDPVLGRMLHEAVVTDESILGGQAMRVHEARWDH